MQIQSEDTDIHLAACRFGDELSLRDVPDDDVV